MQTHITSVRCTACDVLTSHRAARSFVPWNSSVRMYLLITFSHLFVNHGSALLSHLPRSCTLLIQPHINPCHESEILQELAHRDCVDFETGFFFFSSSSSIMKCSGRKCMEKMLAKATVWQTFVTEICHITKASQLWTNICSFFQTCALTRCVTGGYFA